ncbi:bifunctional DNA primase/polymerase [Isoptericola sp. BMS4]|uniref:bifunctional DNA primase/polymerase n=1 Tax=Isoptericola sp. BMS4 TaxID=2527875 RepID=UPI00141DC202|nr:bifunctional DNA primase/polymerase [Isoptericola sp. BMS4]
MTAEVHDLLDQVLATAARGWHVFPLIPGSKRPATPNHPAARCDRTDFRCRDGHTGWEQRATTDPDRITRAWMTCPWGVGIATGPSGLLVIDTDTPKPGDAIPPAEFTGGAANGEDTLAALAAGHGGLPDTWTVTTPSGGVHRYFTTPERLGNSAGLLGWLVDTRGSGGYVVAPPTATPAGRYTVTRETAPAPLPAWLVQRLAGGRHLTVTRTTPVPPAGRVTDVTGYVRAALDGETTKVRAAQPGHRNHTLFVAAVALGQLVAGGTLREDFATGALLDAAAGHITAGAFTDHEAAATIRSGFRAGARTPRRAA